MGIPRNLLTTAMAVMPHRDVDRALSAALSLDVPFWPQLPLLSYYEDMYVQASEHFPGILADMEKRTLRFSVEKFIIELEHLWLILKSRNSSISAKLIPLCTPLPENGLISRPAIRGQLEGPISFGLNVLDQDQQAHIVQRHGPLIHAGVYG